MNKTNILILGAFICVISGMVLYQETHQCPQPPFQSVSDKQQELNDLGYEIAVDGKLGPETQAAWDAEWTKRNFGNEVYK